MGIWIVSTFWQLWVMLLWTFANESCGSWTMDDTSSSSRRSKLSAKMVQKLWVQKLWRTLLGNNGWCQTSCISLEEVKLFAEGTDGFKLCIDFLPFPFSGLVSASLDLLMCMLEKISFLIGITVVKKWSWHCYCYLCTDIERWRAEFIHPFIHWIISLSVYYILCTVRGVRDTAMKETKHSYTHSAYSMLGR